MHRSRYLPPILSAVLALLPLSALLSAQKETPAAPAWKNITDWTDPSPKELQEKIRNRIGELVAKIEVNPLPVTVKVGGKDEERWDNVGYLAVKGLALLQALPHLDEKQHAIAKNGVNAAFKRIAEVVYPEYYPEHINRKDAPSLSPSVLSLRWRLMRGRNYSASWKPGSPPDLSDTERPTKGGEAVGVNYAVPFILLLTEMIASGGLNAKPYGQDNPEDDRAARPFFKPASAKLRLGIARLTCLLLADGADQGETPRESDKAEIHTALKAGSLHSYNFLGRSPAETCLSKSSTAMFGLRAAFNLGVMDYEKEAFLFHFANQPVTKQHFRDRFNDALWHALFILTELNNPEIGDISEPDHVGVLGAEGLSRLIARDKKSRTPTQGLDLQAMKDQPIDLTRYRVLYATKGGRTVLRVQYSESKSALKVPYAAYRYHPYVGSYKGYHTASAAYVMASASGMLGVLMDQLAEKKSIGAAYRVTREAAARCSLSQFEFKQPKATRTFTVTPAPTRRYVRHQFMDNVSKKELEVNTRVAQALNGAVAMMTRRKPESAMGEDTPRALRRDDKGGKPDFSDNRWQQGLCLSGDRAYAGMGFYGLLKAALATHRDHQFVFGPWPWWKDVAEELCQADYLTSGNASRELAIITLTRSFRPTYPGRD